jgi:hypothetical protein
MNVDPFFTCEDDGQGFTNISLYFGDTFSGMVDSYYFDIMQELNAIGNGSYGCLMCDNEYGVTVWIAFGASKFEEISSDDSSLEGVWGTDGVFCLSLELPMKHLFSVISKEKYEAAKAVYENDPIEAKRRDAVTYALNDLLDEDCDETVRRLTSQAIYNALTPKDGCEFDSLFYMNDITTMDNDLVSLDISMRYHDLWREKFPVFKEAFKVCTDRLAEIGGCIELTVGGLLIGNDEDEKVENIFINVHDLSVFIFESGKNFISNGKVYQFRAL